MWGFMGIGRSGWSVMQLLKETRWVKVWETGGGRFVDSKLAWTVEPDAGAFMADWDTADAEGRAEMRAAFAFYPYEFEEDIERIVGHVAESDVAMAAAMRASVFTGEDFVDEEWMAFKREVCEHLARNPPVGELLVETQFYRVYIGEMGLQVDSKVENALEAPSQETLRALVESIEPGRKLARRAAWTIAESPFLLEGLPGEMPLPGADLLFE